MQQQQQKTVEAFNSILFLLNTTHSGIPTRTLEYALANRLIKTDLFCDNVFVDFQGRSFALRHDNYMYTHKNKQISAQCIDGARILKSKKTQTHRKRASIAVIQYGQVILLE